MLQKYGTIDKEDLGAVLASSGLPEPVRGSLAELWNKGNDEANRLLVGNVRKLVTSDPTAAFDISGEIWRIREQFRASIQRQKEAFVALDQMIVSMVGNRSSVPECIAASAGGDSAVAAAAKDGEMPAHVNGQHKRYVEGTDEMIVMAPVNKFYELLRRMQQPGGHWSSVSSSEI